MINFGWNFGRNFGIFVVFLNYSLFFLKKNYGNFFVSVKILELFIPLTMYKKPAVQSKQDPNPISGHKATSRVGISPYLLVRK